MVIADLIFIMIIAIVLSALLIWAFGWRHPREKDTATGGSLLFLFLILMLTMWAGSAWLPPWGPVFYGSSWLSLLLIGIVIALIILAVSERPRRASTLEVVEEDTKEPPPQPGTVFGLFFWSLFIVLLLAVVLSYLV